MVDYDVKKDNWYSPHKILDEFYKLRTRYGDERLKDGLFKRAHEMFDGAVVLLGVYELSDENKYWLQSNNQTNSPDVVACKQLSGTPSGIDLLITQMEMVKMEEHSPTDDIVEFLKMTKLSSKKSYTKYDMIVLTINRKIPYDQDEVKKQLAELNPKSTIYIVGSPTDGDVGDFVISTPHPILYKPVRFNVDKTIKKYWIPEVVSFDRSLEKEIKFIKSENIKPYNTYDILGLNQKAIYKKFGIKNQD